eukprot:2944204-Pleurochrysis_carterae.AAC.1
MAVRWAVKTLRSDWWTAENWLELRLRKYITMDVFRWGSIIFSKLPNADGEWESQVLLDVPDGGGRRSRRYGIRNPIL